MNRLLEGEIEVRVARQHWAVFVPVIGGVVAILAVAAVLLAVTPHTVRGHDLRSVKLYVGLVLALFCLVAFTLRWLRWRYTTYTLTNLRILSSRGILSRRVESISLDRVQDTTVSQSLIGRVFRAGNVEIESAGRDGREVFRLIADPQGFGNALQTAVEAHRRGQPLTSSTPGGQPLPQGYVPPGASGYGPPPGYGPPRSGGGV